MSNLDVSRTTAQPRGATGDEFIFVDAVWNLRHRYRRDPLQAELMTAFRERHFVGVRDESSHRVLFPPRTFGDDSLNDLHDLVEVGPGGIIRTLTIIPGGESSARPPICVVHVQFDGADSASAGELRGVEHLEDPLTLIGMRCVGVFRDDPQGEWSDYWYELESGRL